MPAQVHTTIENIETQQQNQQQMQQKQTEANEMSTKTDIARFDTPLRTVIVQKRDYGDFGTDFLIFNYVEYVVRFNDGEKIYKNGSREWICDGIVYDDEIEALNYAVHYAKESYYMFYKQPPEGTDLTDFFSTFL